MPIQIRVMQDGVQANDGIEEYWASLTVNQRWVSDTHQGTVRGGAWAVDEYRELARGTYDECVAAAEACRIKYPGAVVRYTGREFEIVPLEGVAARTERMRADLTRPFGEKFSTVHRAEG